MKLTREQVAQLSDVELNRAMVWLYGESMSDNFPELEFVEDNGKVLEMDLGSGYWEINYLTDYNLTMPLVIKHKILHSIHYCASGLDDKPIYKAYGQFKCRTESEYCPALLRAYCEFLVLIAMERE